MNHTTPQKLARRKHRIARKLARRMDRPRSRPMFAARNIRYELAERDRGLACGGIGAIHLLARQTGLIDAIDRQVKVLKVHKPYHESDHVLNIAHNISTGGHCLEDIELRRNDEVYLDALGAGRIPDPTTAGDFCRRFQTDEQILRLMEAINEVRLKVWRQQDPAFFQQAILDADGTLTPTTGECKEGMNISYDGQWCYHALLISLAKTKEPLYLVNRSGNRPSHEQADAYLDKAIALCRRGGFKTILLRGDTDFEQTWKLDGWDQAGDITFIFGADAVKALELKAEALSETAWRRLERPPKYEVRTEERARPANVKERIVREKGFKNLVLQWEDVAEFEHRPHRCQRAYRLIALRKKISVEQGQERLFEEYRYFFYITNDRTSPAEQIIFSANDRCDQENLIEQLKNGVQAMRNPLDNLHSNWAYMVMGSLAWSLKAWTALMVPVTPRHAAKHEAEKRSLLRMEFATFRAAVIEMPCQIVRSGGRLIYRLLSWNLWQGMFLRLVERLQCCWLC